MKDKNVIKRTNRLPIQVGALFTDPYEWCLIDWVYWKTNTQSNRQWTCRLIPIQKNTPIKRQQTILDVLERLLPMNLGLTKKPFGKPQPRRYGKNNKTVEVRQSYEYIFNAIDFDKWLKGQLDTLSERGETPLRNRRDTSTKTERPLSEIVEHTSTKTETTIMSNKNDWKKNEEKKEHKKVTGKPLSLLECLEKTGSFQIAEGTSVVSYWDNPDCPKGISGSVSIIDTARPVTPATSRPATRTQDKNTPTNNKHNPRVALDQIDEHQCRQSAFTLSKKFWDDMTPAEKAEVIEKEFPGKYY